MRLYRGCMLSIFALFIAAFSLIFGAAFGILGLLLPSALFGFSYLAVNTIIVELYYLDQEH